MPEAQLGTFKVRLREDAEPRTPAPWFPHSLGQPSSLAKTPSDALLSHTVLFPWP